MSSVNIIDLPPSTNNSTNNPAKPIGVQSDVERGVNKDAHISMPQPLSALVTIIAAIFHSWNYVCYYEKVKI
jgi:hypothetical protein